MEGGFGDFYVDKVSYKNATVKFDSALELANQGSYDL